MQAQVLALVVLTFWSPVVDVAPPAPHVVQSATDAAPRGRYVEARTASVFAGACHYGAEATTAGREALLAWHFEGGRHAGVELAGVDVVAIVVGDENLADATARRATLYVSDRASAAQRETARSLVVERAGRALGTIDAVHAVPIAARFGAETYDVRSTGLFALQGELLPDRACCTMPLSVWYAPFTEVERPIVGRDDTFECSDARVGRVWSRPGENASFSGAFRYGAARTEPARPTPPIRTVER